MNNLVEVLRTSALLNDLGPGYALAALWKESASIVHVELATGRHGPPLVERWREELHTGAQDWPSRFDHVQVLWQGRLSNDPGPDAVGWWLRLGPLVERGRALNVLRCATWPRGSPVLAEITAGQPPKLAVLEPAKVRAHHFASAWQSVGLVTIVEAAQRRGRRARDGAYYVDNRHFLDDVCAAVAALTSGPGGRRVDPRHLTVKAVRRKMAALNVNVSTSTFYEYFNRAAGGVRWSEFLSNYAEFGGIVVSKQ